MHRTKDEMLAMQSSNNRIAAIILLKIKVMATAQRKIRTTTIVQHKIKTLIMQLKTRALVQIILHKHKEQTRSNYKPTQKFSHANLKHSLVPNSNGAQCLIVCGL